MSNTDSRISRRHMLKATAGTVVAASALSLPGIARAQAALKWGSSSLGSTGYVIIEALASSVNQHTDLRNSSLATSGGAENMALLGEGIIDLGQTTSSDWPAAVRGEPPYQAPIDCHQMFAYTLWNMPPIVRADSDIKVFADLAGRRIMPSQPTSSAGAMYKVIFTAAGMDEGVSWSYGSWQETYDALKAGNADAIPALITNGRPSPILSELIISNQVRGIEVPPEIFSQAREMNPGILALEADPAVWGENGAPIMAPAISGVVGARRDLDPDVAYAVTKAIFDNEEKVRQIGVQLQDIRLDFAVQYLMPEYPVNAGAARYFQERGVWREDLEIAGS